MSDRNRNVLLIVVLAVIVVFIVDQTAIRQLLGLLVSLAQLAFFSIGTVWLIKHL